MKNELHWNWSWDLGMKCENEDCDNLLPQNLAGCLCSGYMDCSDGERWCNCCEDCRSDCHNGAIEEMKENGDAF